MSFAHSYAKEVHNYFEIYYANWMPESPIDLGDIGELTNGEIFQRKENIKNYFNIDISKKPSTVTLPVKGTKLNHYQVKTGNGVSSKLIASGAASLVNGGLELTFDKENSFFFNLAGVVAQEIDAQLTLQDKILDLYKRKSWKKEWYIVTSILYSSSTTILGSSAGKQTVVLEAATDVPVTELENAELQFKLSGSQDLAYKMVSGPGAIPLFKLSRIRKKRFKPTTLGLTDDEDINDDDFRDMAIAEDIDLNEVFGLYEEGKPGHD